MVKETLADWEQKNQKIRGLFKILCDPFYLVRCYNEIRSIPGNMTKGATPETLDKIDFPWFERTTEKLKKHQFRFSPARRIEIPKANSTKLRPLTIATPREKIVQKGIQLIFQAIWEKKFLDSSHGFRPNRSVHSALKALYLKGQTYTWVIQGDISKCFDKIPHSIIIKNLSKEIADTSLLNLVRDFLNAGHINPHTKRLEKPGVGVPQGGVLSPVLCNIVLHEFDTFVHNAITKFERGKKRRHNPEYQKLQLQKRQAKTVREKLELLRKKRTITHGDPLDPNFRRMMYVRYADDFVILIIGTKAEAALMKARCKDALNRLCGAELSEEKTLITHMKEGFSFLGADIRKLDKNMEFLGKTGIGTKTRVFTRRLQFNAPLKKLIANLEKASMVKKNGLGKVTPISCTKLTNKTHYDIL